MPRAGERLGEGILGVDRCPGHSHFSSDRVKKRRGRGGDRGGSRHCGLGKDSSLTIFNLVMQSFEVFLSVLSQ